MCHSREEIERMLARHETSPEAEAFRAHLKTCEHCYDQAGRVVDETLVRRVAEEGGHVEPLVLSRYLDRELPEHVGFLVEEHLRACPECRKVLDAMRTGRHLATAVPVRVFSYRPGGERVDRGGRLLWPRFRTTLLLPVGAAAAVAIVWLGSHLLSREFTPDMANRPTEIVAPKPPTDVTPPPRPAPRPPVRPEVPPRPVPRVEPKTSLRPSPQVRPAPRPKPAPGPEPMKAVTPPGPGVLLARLPEDPDSLPAWARSDLERVWTEPPATRSATVPPPPSVTLLSPEPGNRALLDRSPEFVWTAVEGADKYEVRLVTDPSDPDKEPQPVGEVEVTEPRHRFETPLVPGEWYVFSVRPMAPEENGLGEAFGEASFRFEALDAVEAEQARWARVSADKYPVTAAMALHRLGRFRDAAETTSHWPEDVRLSDWKAAIRAAQEDRLANPAQ